ncbi:MAG TPA: methionyl-tRNA formyltransferase [Bacillales bacterium]|jgi:methionyl-tRNA formyltransferase|nr:methionyl-tRNA formyltransferase [Bacillales bacterium]
MRIVFMGTPDFSVPILRRLISDGHELAAVVTQPDRPKGRKKRLTPPPVKVEAEKHGIPVLQPKKIRQPEEIEKVLSFDPDLIVTAAFGQILTKPLLEGPKHGCVNVHASLLPEYRGGAPIHQAILDGKEETGVTIMYMAEKLDAGDILSQTVVPIDETDTVGTLHDKLSCAGEELLSNTLKKLESGKVKPLRQDEDKATFASNISREQERIDWNAEGTAIYNRIRGLNPWPGAYTLYDGRVLKIWQAGKEPFQSDQPPGTILEVDKDSFLVKSGDGVALRIKELQPAGKKRMTAESFLQGVEMKTGDRLGE